MTFRPFGLTTLALTLIACGTEPVVTTVTLSPTSVTLDAIGATSQVNADLKDQDGKAIQAIVSWTSSDDEIATVSTSGLVTAVANGTVTVQATANGVSATSTVTVQQVPAAVVALSGEDQTANVNEELPDSIVVQVRDRLGNPIAGAAVTFTPDAGSGSANPASAGTDVDGQVATTWTLGNTSGEQRLTASATEGSASVVITATGQADVIMSINDGDGQTGLVDTPVNIPPSVIARNASGTPVAGVTVTFSVVSGGGSVSGGVQITGPDGIAEVGSWTLGVVEGANTLSATATATGSVANSPLAFSATGITAQYDIEIRFLDPQPSNAQKQVFAEARARWEAAVIGDLQDVPVNFDSSTTAGCHDQIGALNETIDDLVIYAQIDSIDGAGGVLGRAGPCGTRSTDELPFLGRMVFDSADVTALETAGRFDEVILHEMGHVLGFGVLWDRFDLRVNPSCPENGGTAGADTHFPGARAVAAFDRVGGDAYTAGGKVPVENDSEAGCPGTRDAHWRESELDEELMTGFLNVGANPLSIVSFGSLWDMDYTVNYSAADAYAYPSAPAPAAGAGSPVRLIDDVWTGPLLMVDPAGRIVKILRPRGAR